MKKSKNVNHLEFIDTEIPLSKIGTIDITSHDAFINNLSEICISDKSIIPSKIDLSKYLADANTESEASSFYIGNSEHQFKHIYIGEFDILPLIEIIKDIKKELADRGNFHVNVPKFVDILFKLGVVFANDMEE